MAEAFLQGVSILEMAGAAFGHGPKGARKLLVHQREIQLLGLAIAREGMTAVATRLYFKGGRVKVEIALARGKKVYDKRETLKTREAEREALIPRDEARVAAKPPMGLRFSSREPAPAG